MIKVRINFTPASGALSHFEDCKAVDPAGIVWTSVSGRWLRLTPVWVENSVIGPNAYEI